MLRNAPTVSKLDLEFFKHIRQVRVQSSYFIPLFSFFLKHPRDNAAHQHNQTSKFTLYRSL